MEKEYKKRQSINMASMRMMRHLKQTGHPILVFPSGTRYRPGEISTLKAIKEMDSYLRIFDTVVFVGLNGVLQSLEKKQGKMIHESVREDTIIASVSPIHSSLEYRERLREQKKKQDPQANEDQLRDYVCSHITESLKEQHQLGAQYYHQVCQQWPINHIDEYRPQNEQFFSL